MVDDPKLARLGMQGGGLDIAMPDRPDRRIPARLIGIAREGRAVAIETHDLAEMIGGVLRLLLLRVALADREEERSVRHKDDTRAEMHIGGNRRLLAEDHAHIREAAAACGQLEATTRHAGVVEAVLTGLGKCEEDLLRGRKIGRESHVEEPALADRVDFRHAGNRR